MKTFRNRMLDAIGIKRFRRLYVLVPMKVCKKVELIYQFLYKNQLSFHFLMDMFFATGVDVFFDLIEKQKIQNIWHLLRLIRMIKNTVPKYVENIDEEPFIPLSVMKHISLVFRKYKFTQQHEIRFLDYAIKSHSLATNHNKYIIGKKEINILFKLWVKEERNENS